ncbi:protein ABHD16B-like [Python bivittatus]|uniref:Protein ABHD16B-like n=1 Tax=Python bivittatus TaxID=176946 RepID=A0A9F2QZ25_PYTBI|nr:protein ABHD16B-like [Python bivittatus]
MCFKIWMCLMIKDSYSFKKWPVEYCWDETSRSTSSEDSNRSHESHLSGMTTAVQDRKAKKAKISILRRMKHGSNSWIRYTLAHTVGRWLLYPGSVYLLNKVPLTLLVNGRTRLMENFHGKRAKLVARDGNEIDTMFVDRRGKRFGKQLVISCEGNGSFYEVGCFITPLKAGYSVLGWNHPGFARSSGKPYPQNDINAMDVVIRYAMHRLNFSLEDIAIYGYSLGSYTATWAAMAYPELGALVLDASFDSLLPLAAKVVAKKLRKLVLQTIREHFNLNVADMLCHYQGPVLLIRRTLDEITSTHFHLENHLPMVQTNRANELLLQILRCRYPDIISGVEEVVCQLLTADCPQVESFIYHHFYRVDDKWCLHQLKSYQSSLGQKTEFPWKVGSDLSSARKKHMALFLAKKHLKNVETTHGRTLPPEEFELPWKL